jgi:hypothetical protein
VSWPEAEQFRKVTSVQMCALEQNLLGNFELGLTGLEKVLVLVRRVGTSAR